MKEIPLTKGKVALVDDEDYEQVNAFKWHAKLAQNNGRWYAERGIYLPNGKQSRQSMHRFIMGLDYGDPREVDHKDRINTLDNRRSNLRVTLNQNPQNRGIPKTNTSGFKGVSWSQQAQKWRAQIEAGGKSTHLGYFSTPELAAAAYDAAAIEYHKEFAVTNASLAAAA
jgi:hypothetical protein